MSNLVPKQEIGKRPVSHLFVSVGIWFATFCWGSAYVAARFLLHSDKGDVFVLHPVMLAALRFSVAALFFLVPLGRGMIRREMTARHLLLMVLLGQLTFTLYYWLQYIGIEQTNASVSSILGVGLIPLFTTVIAQLSGTERQYFPVLGALVLGLIGVGMVVFEQPLRAPWHSGFLIGSLCLITNTFFFAVYSNLSKRWMQDIAPLMMTSGTMVSGAIGLLLLSFFDSANNQWSQITLLNTTQWFALLFLAIGCSVLAYFAYNFALSKRDASQVAVYFYVEPVIATILGVMLLGEPLTWHVIVGAVIIGLSVILVNRVKKERLSL